MTTPFNNVEEAWLWYIKCNRARHSGAKARGGGMGRPCDPSDIYLAAKTLRGLNLLTIDEMGVLHWTIRNIDDDGSISMNSKRTGLFDSAMATMEQRLIKKSIVVKKANCGADH